MLASSPRKRVRTILLVVLAILVVIAWQSDLLVLEGPELIERYYAARLGHRLRDKQKVAALLTFDAGEIREAIGRAPCRNVGTRLVPGRIGSAREFDGTDSCFIQTSAVWHGLGKKYSITCWVRIERDPDRQAIVFADFGDLATGIMLENGQLFFRVPSSKTNQVAAYTFENYGRFVHLAAVADVEQGKASFYEDGVLKATCELSDVRQPPYIIEFGKAKPWRISAPFHGALDETIVWNKALTPGEVAKLSRARTSALETLAPLGYVEWRAAAGLRQSLLSAARSVDLFSPFHHVSHAYRAGVPVINLAFSVKDSRHFNKAHNKCLANGYFIDSADERRHVEVVTDDGLQSAGLRLYGDESGSALGRRKAYVLEMDEGRSLLGSKRLLLVPPEDRGFVVPLFERALADELKLPGVGRRLCILAVNGAFQGVYLCEDYDQLGVQAHAGGEGRGGLNLEFLPFTPEESLRRFDAVWDAMRGVILNDPSLLLSRRQVAREVRKERDGLEHLWRTHKQMSAAEKAGRFFDEYLLLGANPSPLYVVTNLSLAGTAALEGVDTRWSSSQPELISSEGVVARPTGDIPEEVKLTAEFSSAGTTVTNQFRFRVMPERIKLPSLFVVAPGEINNFVRMSCLAELVEDSGARRSGWRPARIKWRGNTVLLNDKKSFSVKFKEPHGFLDMCNSRYLYLMSACADRSFSKNQLSYGWFRSFGTEDSPRFAPRAHSAELFVNGDYRGIYDLGERVDRDMVGLEEYEAGEMAPAVMYKAVGARANFRVPAVESMIQEQPDPAVVGPYWQPYIDLVRFVGEAPREDFVRDIDEWIDLPSFMDFHIILNLASNGDGADHNYFLARHAGAGQKFFIVPWDYDKTYGKELDRWLTNFLFNRLLAESPEYRKAFKARWAELRKGVLADDAVRDRLASQESMLDGYATWNYERWQTDEQELKPLIEEIRSWLLPRLKFMDGYIGAL